MSLPTHEDLSIYPREELEQSLTKLLQQIVPSTGIAPATQEQRKMGGDPHRVIFDQMNAQVQAKTGNWYWGPDFAHPEAGWCVCHKLFKNDKPIVPADIPAAVQSLLGAVDSTHDYVQNLREFCDAASAQGTNNAALEQLSANINKMIRLTISETNCDSSWYLLASENLNILIDELELSDNAEALSLVQGQIANLMDSRFESWVEPGVDTIDDVTRQIEIEVLKELFDRKYV